MTVTAPTWLLGGLEEGLGWGGGWLLSAKDVRVRCLLPPCAVHQNGETRRRGLVPGAGSGLCPSGVGLDGGAPLTGEAPAWLDQGEQLGRPSARHGVAAGWGPAGAVSGCSAGAS